MLQDIAIDNEIEENLDDVNCSTIQVPIINDYLAQLISKSLNQVNLKEDL